MSRTEVAAVIRTGAPAMPKRVARSRIWSIDSSPLT